MVCHLSAKIVMLALCSLSALGFLRARPVPQMRPASSGYVPNKPNGHAIVFTDLKLDDTAALHHLAKTNEYDHIHVVGTGVKNQEAAHGHLKDFVRQQPGMDAEKMTYYNGGKDILNQDPMQTHERYFQGVPTAVTMRADRDLERSLPRGSNVDIYHIAPTAESHIHNLADNEAINIRTYHHVAGYNSHVNEESHRNGHAPETEKFLTNVQSRIKKKHPSANVMFTSNDVSFKDTGGSTQPLKVLQGRYPANHLNAAKNDPFHLRTLTEAEKHVAPIRKAQIEANDPNRAPHLHPTNPGHAIDQATINKARFDEPDIEGRQPIRDHLTKYLDHAQKVVRSTPSANPKLSFRLETGVRDAFTKKARLELCDAVHTACVNKHRRKGEMDNVRPATCYCDTSSGKPIMKVRESLPNDPHHGYLLVNQTGKEARKALFGDAQHK